MTTGNTSITVNQTSVGIISIPYMVIQGPTHLYVTKENSSMIGVYNVATGKEKTIKQLAQEIIKKHCSKSKIIYAPERLGDIKGSVADISKIKRVIGWKPKYIFEQGIKETIEWFENK